MPFMDECVKLDECAIYGGMCHLWRNVSVMYESTIYGGMCHLWMNVPFMDECNICE